LQIAFSHLPQQRRLEQDLVDEASKLLAMKCNKVMLQSHLQKTSGRVVTGRDISNIRKGMKNGGKKNDLEAIAKKLSENPGT
jgi:hypothetical protein